MDERTGAPAGRIADSGFRAGRGLGNRHVQSVLGGMPGLRRPSVTRERWELDDGDFLDVDWLRPDGRAWALVLPGLTGGLGSAYAVRLLRALATAGYRAGLLNYRGHSGRPNRLATGYHAGFTRDLDTVAQRLAGKYGPGVVAGYSLGGNLLLKWLGETGDDAPVRAAAAVSVPFDLAAAAASLRAGPARAYDRYLLIGLRRYVRRKFRDRRALPMPLSELGGLKSIEAFDERITAPLHGFDGAADYYARASCRPWLAKIRVPTLVLNARDDPLVPADSLPAEQDLGASVTLALSDRGGHVGFIDSHGFGWPRYWLESRLLSHLAGDREPPPANPGGDGL